MLLMTNYQFLGRQMVHMCDMLTYIDYSLYLWSTSKALLSRHSVCHATTISSVSTLLLILSLQGFVYSYHVDNILSLFVAILFEELYYKWLIVQWNGPKYMSLPFAWRHIISYSYLPSVIFSFLSYDS